MTDKKKKCRECGGMFTYDLLVGNVNSASGVRNLCKKCCTVAKNKANALRKAELKRLAELEAQRRKNDPNMAKPRTFSHLKDKETWTGWKEPYYIRNEGLKHIPSRGIV